jgi:hypothetical protein
MLRVHGLTAGNESIMDNAAREFAFNMAHEIAMCPQHSLTHSNGWLNNAIR